MAELYVKNSLAPAALIVGVSNSNEYDVIV